MIENEVYVLKANNANLFAYSDKVVIKRKGLYSLTAPNGKKETEIFYNTLFGIDYKKPNRISGNGYFRFLKNCDTYKPQNWKFDIQELSQEENTIFLLSANGNLAKQSEEIYNFIISKVSEILGEDEFADRNNAVVQNSLCIQECISHKSKPITKKERVKENKRNAVACCPKCGSTSLSANKKGFGIGKAVIGATIIGNPIGLVAGNINAKKVRVTCLNCGHQFWAGKK